METLNSTEPHFIRCMKPNMEKVGRKYDSHVMLFQLRYAGFLEVCRIRQLGYPNRLSFEKFVKLYGILAVSNGKTATTTAPATSSAVMTPAEILRHLEANRVLVPGQCVIGNTKIFVKHAITAKLDALRDEIYFSYVARIQKLIRGVNQRSRFRLLKRTLDQLKAAIGMKELLALEDAIAASVELPYEGINMPLVKEAKRLLKRLKEEEKMNRLLEEAIQERQILALETALRTVKSMTPPLQSPQLQHALDLLSIVKQEKELLNQGSILLHAKHTATTAGSRIDELEIWLSSAQRFHHLCATDTYKSLQIIVDRLREEESVLQEMSQAITMRDLNLLTASLTRAMEMGLAEERPEVIEKAKKAQIEFENHSLGVKILEVALESPVSYDSLHTAVEKAKSRYGVTAAGTPLMKTAQRTCDLLYQLQVQENQLKSAVERREAEEIQKEVTKAEALQKVCEKDPILSQHLATIEIHGLDVAQAFLLKQAQQLQLQSEAQQRLSHQQSPHDSYASSVDPEQLIEQIRSAMQLHDISYLRPLVAEAKGMGLTHDPKHQQLLQEADQVVLSYRVAMEIDMNLTAALKMKDLDALNRAIEHAQQSSVSSSSPSSSPARPSPPSLASAIAMREEILRHNELMDRLKSAIDQKKIDVIREVVKEATALGLRNRHVDDGKHLLEREDLKIQLEKELLETSNHQLLSSALDKTVQYGINSDAVNLARVRYEQIKVHRTVLDEIRFAMKNIELLRSTEDGLREVDLISLRDLLQSLEEKEGSGSEEGGQASFSAEMRQIQKDGTQTLQRSLKQIEIQVPPIHILLADRLTLHRQSFWKLTRPLCWSS
jgi:myosin heavy subunit